MPKRSRVLMSAALLVGLFFGTTASAATGQHADIVVVDPDELAVLVRDLGLDPAIVEAGLRATPAMDRAMEHARQSLGLLFAGAWRTEPASPTLSVAAKGGVPGIVQAELLAMAPTLAFTFVDARFSLAELEAIKDAIPSGVEWISKGVAITDNLVEIVVPHGAFEETRKLLLAALPPDAPIRVREGSSVFEVGIIDETVKSCRSRTDCSPTARAGIEINMLNAAGASVYRCSSAFNGIRNGANVMLTAGHCRRAENVSHSVAVPWGQYVASRFPGAGATGDTDGAVYSMNAAWYPSRFVYWANNNKEYKISARQIEANQRVNDPICKSGITTNTTCGVITAVNQDIGVADETGGVHTLTDQTFTNLCAERGDSGGSVQVTGRAYGVVSASRLRANGTCDGLMTYTPIRRIETRLGVVVRTTDP